MLLKAVCFVFNSAGWLVGWMCDSLHWAFCPCGDRFNHNSPEDDDGYYEWCGEGCCKERIVGEPGPEWINFRDGS